MNAEGIIVRLREAVPAALILLVLLLLMVPFRPLDQLGFAPPVTLMAVVFWALFVPASLPLWLVGGLGLAEDLLTGAPFGLNALLLMLAVVAVDALRRDLIDRSFPWLWLGYALVSGLFVSAEWMGFSIAARDALDFAPAALRWALGVALFPLFLRFWLMPMHGVVMGR